jgi:formylglycine-generating enzyme required for sulfatase activity
MPKRFRWTPWALAAIVLAGAPMSGALAAEASSAASAGERQQQKAEGGPELRKPDGQSRRAPSDPAQQHAELLRVTSIPLPSFEDRIYLDALMGIGAGDEDPIKGNAGWLKDHLGKRPAPDAAEQRAFLERLKHELIFVQGGDFMMGDFGTLTKYKLRIAFNKSTLPHKVTLDSYSLMRGAVTNGDYDFYSRMTGTPPVNVEWVDIFSRFPGYVARPITWPQADNYCRWLADFTKMPFALPTEAQWEYAARERGKFIAYPAYNLPGVKWASEYIPEGQSLDAALTALEAKAGGKTDMTQPEPPDLDGANRIGMEGALGYGSEWASDWYEEKPSLSPSRNPKGPPSGTLRVLRFSASSEYRMVITRAGQAPDVTHQETLFRCALNVGAPWK